MQITQLDHFVLTVQDIEETCRFYEDALGMKTIAFGAREKLLSVYVCDPDGNLIEISNTISMVQGE